MDLFSKRFVTKKTYNIGVLIVTSFLFFGQIASAEVISGTLFESDGVTAIIGENLVVDVMQSDNNDPCQTNYVTGMGINTADGTYSISNVPSGNYYLRISNSGTNYIEEYWASTASEIDCRNAEIIAVVEGTPVENKNFQLDVGGSVAGMIYQNDGITAMPDQEMGVNLFKWQYDEKCGQYEYSAGSRMNSDGSYLVTGVSPGTYYMNTWSNGTAYIDEYWADPVSTQDCQDAQTVTIVAPNDAVVNKNFQLELGGTVTGTVYHTDGTTPITDESVRVSVFQWSNGVICEYPQNYLSETTIQSDGSFYLGGIAPGDYYLQIISGTSNYIGEYWASSESVRDCQSSESFTVTEGALLTNKDFRLELGGSISGTVYYSDGTTPITGETMGVEIFSIACGGDWIGSADIDHENGTYTITGIPAGDWYIRSNSNWATVPFVDEWYAGVNSNRDCDQALPVSVVSGGIESGKNFQLDIGGSVSGTLFEDDGVSPILNNTNLNINIRQGSDPCSSEQIIGTRVNSDGTYLIEGVLPGDNYYLDIWDNGGDYIQEYWAESSSVLGCQDAENFTIVAEQVTQEKNFQLGKGDSISGVVYQADGTTPLVGVDMWISAFTGGNACDFDWVRGAALNTEDGTYNITGLDAGTYYIRTGSSQSDYVSEFWAAAGSVIACDDAEEVTIITGNDTLDKNFQLAEGGSISGTLYQSDGVTPLTGVSMRVYALSGGNACFPHWGQRGEVDTSTGSYWLRGIPAGSYFVQAGGDDSESNYVPEFWANSLSDSACENADPISVEVGQISSNKDFQIDLGFSISGNVFETNGTTPLTGEAELEVTLFKDNSCNGYANWHREGTVNDIDGSFIIRGLENGLYYMRADTNDAAGTTYIGEYYGDPTSVRSCLQAGEINISNSNASGINFQLDTGACAISGSIFKDDGTLVGEDDGGVVALHSSPCNSIEWTGAGGINDDGSGAYKIGGLEPGTYYLQTLMNWSSNPNEWWKDTASTYDCSEAQLVTCSAGVVTIGKDFNLGLGLEHVVLMIQLMIGQEDVNGTIHIGMDKNNDGKIGLAEVVDAMRELAGM